MHRVWMYPRQRHSREEHAEIKQGTVPESFQQNENRLEPKDVAARWAKKGEDVHDGYKNHVKADRTTTLIEDDAVTDASVHDSQAVEDLVEADDGIVYADSAYTGEAIEMILEEHGVTGEICEKGYWNHPLTTAQKKRNRKKEHDQGLCGAYVRVHDEYDERRVEHEMDRDAAEHRRDRTVESGVHPGPLRTDPEVNAGVVGLEDEQTSERRNNETEKAKTRGEQRQSGCQKTKNGG